MNRKTPAELWVDALRSGEFKQWIGGELRLGDYFCCLGVACELYEREVGGLRIEISFHETLYDGERATLPRRVQEWLGLGTNSGVFEDEEVDCAELTTINDSGATFAEIADIIESRPPGLFLE